MPLTKTINGRRYSKINPLYTNKSEANTRASKLRKRYKNGSFRVIKITTRLGKRYAIYGLKNK